jgi:hypothetical protein
MEDEVHRRAPGSSCIVGCLWVAGLVSRLQWLASGQLTRHWRLGRVTVGQGGKPGAQKGFWRFNGGQPTSLLHGLLAWVAMR